MRVKLKKLYTEGFTLIELVMVMAIVAIIAVLSIVIVKVAMERSRTSKLVADAKTMKNALIAYSQANGGNYPGAQMTGGGAVPAYDLVLDPALSTEKIRRSVADLSDASITTNVNGIMRPFVPDPDNFRDTSTSDKGFLCYLANSSYCPTGFCLWVVPDNTKNAVGNVISGCAGSLAFIRDNYPSYWFSECQDASCKKTGT